MELPIPIHILKPGDSVPEETCYLITRDGVFLHKQAGVIEALVKVEGICFLKGVTQKAIAHLPKIPVVIMSRILSFFRHVHETMNSEANLMLHYRRGRWPFKLSCPFQKVTAGSVDYQPDGSLEGYQLVGTIHSHNRMSAFHSGIDQSDEEFFDGLHITIGRLDMFPEFSISCSVMVNSQRFMVEPKETIDGLVKIESGLAETDDGFIGGITCAIGMVGEVLINPLGDSILSGRNGSHFSRYSQMYRLEYSGDDDFPAEWLDRVEKKRFLGLGDRPGLAVQDLVKGGYGRHEV